MLQKVELPQLAHSHAQSSGVDFCGSTAMAMPESEGIDRQIDWKAQQTLHFIWSAAWQCRGA